MNFRLNKNLAELIGAFIGDGFIGKYNSHYHVEFIGNSNFDSEYFDFLSKIITDNFNVKPRIKIKENTIRMIVTYKELYFFFHNLGFNTGIKNDKVFIPTNLYRSQLNKYVIRGLFDTDGYLFIDKRKIYKNPYVRIGFSTKSKKLSDQLKLLFSQRGYELYLRIDKRYKVYNIEIYGNKQASRWLKEFGFSNNNKKNFASVAQLVERQ